MLPSMPLLLSLLVALGLQTTELPRFLDLGTGAVVDTEAMVVWTDASSAAMTREAVDAYLTRLDTAGYTDWRLPSADELRELMDQQHCRKIDGASQAPTV